MNERQSTRGLGSRLGGRRRSACARPEADDAQGARDPRSEAPRGHGRVPQDHSPEARQELGNTCKTSPSDAGLIKSEVPDRVIVPNGDGRAVGGSAPSVGKTTEIAPGRIRTSDTRVSNPLLLSAELPARDGRLKPGGGWLVALVSDPGHPRRGRPAPGDCGEWGRRRGLADATSRRVQQIAKQRVLALAAVVAPRPLVQVALKPLVRDRVVRSPHARLEQTEEAVNRLRMHSPST
jgi:hypothetical protein